MAGEFLIAYLPLVKLAAVVGGLVGHPTTPSALTLSQTAYAEVVNYLVLHRMVCLGHRGLRCDLHSLFLKLVEIQLCGPQF